MAGYKTPLRAFLAKKAAKSGPRTAPGWWRSRMAGGHNFRTPRARGRAVWLLICRREELIHTPKGAGPYGDLGAPVRGKKPAVVPDGHKTV